MAHPTNTVKATGGDPPSKLASLHVPVIAAFAVSQPLFDLTARHAQLYVARGLRPADVVLLAAVLGLGLPLALGGVELAAGLGGRRARQLMRGLLIAALAAAAVLPVATGTAGLAGVPAVAVALAVGIGFTFAYRRWAPLRSFLSLLVPVLVVFPAYFLSQRPVGQLIWPHDFPRPEIEVTNEVPVVVVVLDELPLSALLDAHLDIDAVHFPYFAELARDATWFRQASAVSDSTPFALAALLTGRYPEPEDRRTAALANFPENLFTFLGPAVHLQVEESTTRLCPEEYRTHVRMTGFPERNLDLYQDLSAIYLRLVTPAPWSERLPVANATWTGFWQPPAPQTAPSNRRRRQLDAFLAGLADEPNGLHFLHLILPHLPWEFLPSGQVYNDHLVIPGWEDPILKEQIWEDDPWVVELAYQRFLGQLVHTDHWLGEIMDQLRELGLYERALFVVTSDHGAVYRPGARKRGSGPEDIESEVMPVPFFVKRPHQEDGAVSDRNVESIDLVPTIAEVLGVSLPWPVDGVSIFADGPERPAKLFYASKLAAQYQPHRAPPRLSGLEKIVAWKLATFTGGAGSPDGLFHFGPHRDLVGRPLAELAIEGTSDLRTVLLRSELYQDVDPEGPFVPAYVLGEVHETPGDWRHDLAIAVNGTVRAVTRSYRQGPVEERFAALVGNGAFRRGANDVEVLEIRSRNGRRTVASTATLGRTEDRQARFDDLQVATGGWRFVVPLADVRALQQVELRIQSENGEPALEIQARSIDPAVEIPLPEYPGTSDVMLRLTVTSPADTDLRVFYLAGEEMAYRPAYSRSHPLRQGLNTLILELRDAEIHGPLRLDPGSAPGRYLLHDVEIRSAIEPVVEEAP